MARHHIIPMLIALCLSTALAVPATAQDEVAPVLTELHPNPPGADRGNEWVEFVNPTPVPMPLEGLYLSDWTGNTLALSGTVPGMAHLVFPLPTAFPLTNTGDNITLYALDGEGEPIVLQQVAYGNKGSLTAPAEGESLAACHHGANLHGAWDTAQASPGATNPGC